MYTATSDQIVEAAKFRYCCRNFTDKKIPEKDFAALMEAARWTPSPFGIEPWKVLVINDLQLRHELSAALPGAQNGQLRSASHFCVIFSAGEKWLNAEHGQVYDFFKNVQQQPPASMEYFHRTLGSFYPSIGLVDEMSYRTYATRSCHILLGNILTNASLMKIDSACMEGVNPDKMTELIKDKGLIDTEVYSAVLAIALGYREAEPAQPRIKKPLDDFVIYPGAENFAAPQDNQQEKKNKKCNTH